MLQSEITILREDRYTCSLVGGPGTRVLISGKNDAD